MKKSILKKVSVLAVAAFLFTILHTSNAHVVEFCCPGSAGQCVLGGGNGGFTCIPVYGGATKDCNGTYHKDVLTDADVTNCPGR